MFESLAAKVLALAKTNGASSAEVGINDLSGFFVNVRMGEVETVEQNHDTGLDITAFYGQRSGVAVTSDLSNEAITLAVEKACYMARMAAEDTAAGLAEKADMAYTHPDLQLYHPWNMPIDQAIECALKSEQDGLALDKRITNSEGVNISSMQSRTAYANSNDFYGEYQKSSYRMGSSFIAEANGCKQRDYDYTVARDPMLLQNFSDIARNTAQKTVQRLGAKTISTQKTPVIFAAKVAKSLWGSLISALSGSQLYRQASFLQDSLGSQLFPKFINIDERPHLPRMLGSAPYDADGVKTRDKFIVADGAIKSYLLSTYSARKMHMQTTGNAGGIHNLFVSHGDQDLTALLKSMQTGLLVTELIGQGVNILTGDYSRGAFGFWVENGEIQYPVHEITIAGNLRDMYKNIIAVGNDIDQHGALFTGSVLIDNMMVAGTS